MNILLKNIVFSMIMIIAILTVGMIVGFEVAVLFSVLEVAVIIYSKIDNCPPPH